MAHLGPAAQFGHEVGVQPRLVDAQPGIGHQAVPVEAFDVVAFVGGAVPPDRDAVGGHRADQQGAGDRASDRCGVEVGFACGFDVEGAALQGDHPLLHERFTAVDQPGQLGAISHGPAGYPIDFRLVVLADVRGVGAGHGSPRPHPGHCHRGVESSREGDANAFTDRETRQYLGHDPSLTESYAAVKPVNGRVGRPSYWKSRIVMPIVGWLGWGRRTGLVCGDRATPARSSGPVRRARAWPGPPCR